MSGSARGVGPYHISAFGGAYRTCPVCGKKWYVLEVDSWAYVRWTKKDKSGIPTAFCSWGCLRKWDKDHPLTAHQNPVLIVRPAKNKKQKGDKD